MIAFTLATVGVIFAEASSVSRSAHKEIRTTQAAIDKPTPSPWYIRAASQQIVNFCVIGGLMGGFGGAGGGGFQTMGGGYSIQAQPSYVTFSDNTAFTYTTSSSTTLYTTIPGGVVTIYRSDPTPTMTMDDGVAYSATLAPPVVTEGSVATDGPESPDASVVTDGPVATDGSDTTGDWVSADPSPTVDQASPAQWTPATTSHPMGIVGELQRLNSYAHDIANAIIAPHQMTEVFSSAYEAIMQHGFIPATQAVKMLSRADEGLKALHTDPAYSKQRVALAAHPTPINYNNAFEKFGAKHSNGFAKLMAEPSGRKAYHMIRSLGEKFMKDFSV